MSITHCQAVDHFTAAAQQVLMFVPSQRIALDPRGNSSLVALSHDGNHSVHAEEDNLLIF